MRFTLVGSQMADFTKQLFIPAAICLMFVVSAYFWSGFPYVSIAFESYSHFADVFADIISCLIN